MYRNEIFSYHGWSWSNSAFYNTVVVLVAFEVANSDFTSAMETVKKGIEVMRAALNPLMQNYDESVIDSLPIRRRRKEHRIEIFKNFIL